MHSGLILLFLEQIIRKQKAADTDDTDVVYTPQEERAEKEQLVIQTDPPGTEREGTAVQPAASKAQRSLEAQKGASHTVPAVQSQFPMITFVTMQLGSYY